MDNSFGLNGIIKLDDTSFDTADLLLTSDWHLWLKDRENGTDNVYKRPNFDRIMDMYMNIHTYKKLIHLGDLTDDEMKDPEELIFYMKKISCPKILIRGNNDTFEDDVYKACGFMTLFNDGFIFDNKMFTHMPHEHDCDLNVHGHSHGHRYYWNTPFHKHLDIWNIDRAPIKYSHLQKMYDEYRVSGIKDVSGMHMTGPEFKKYRGFYNGKKKEEW